MRRLYLLGNLKASAHGRVGESYEQNARALAEYIQGHGVTPSVVLCPSVPHNSSLLELLAPALAGDVNIIQVHGIQAARSRDLLSYLRSTSDAVDSLMLIGRRKALRKLALRLAGSSQGTLLKELRSDFPPLAMAVLELPGRPWRTLNRSDGQLVSLYRSRPTEPLTDSYFDYYDGEKSYDETFKEYFGAKYVVDMLEAVWGIAPPYSLLDAGSANGMTLKALAKKNVDAWGIENSAYIHGQTRRKWRARNLLGDVRKIPFPDKNFDFTYDTCLCYVAGNDVDEAIREIRRVTRLGAFFGSIVKDMRRDRDRDGEDLFYGVKTLLTLPQWSERFLANGFRLAIPNEQVMKKVWKLEKRANDDDPWYPSRESMRYCFYTPC
jgi:SAM-dependent methyltransferase/phosphohistidine phosphatase SixA